MPEALLCQQVRQLDMGGLTLPCGVFLQAEPSVCKQGVLRSADFSNVAILQLGQFFLGGFYFCRRAPLALCQAFQPSEIQAQPLALPQRLFEKLFLGRLLRIGL